MREDGGWDVIIAAVEKLGKKHMEHIAAYGTGNERRLTGAHETAPIDKFNYGVANRGASVRIPRTAEKDKRVIARTGAQPQTWTLTSSPPRYSRPRCWTGE